MLQKIISTTNGCYRSDISVNPKNWNTKKASVNCPWRINYQFYDPSFKDHPKLKKGKQVKILGMNHLDSLERSDKIAVAMSWIKVYLSTDEVVRLYIEQQLSSWEEGEQRESQP